MWANGMNGPWYTGRQGRTHNRLYEIITTIMYRYDMRFVLPLPHAATNHVLVHMRCVVCGVFPAARTWRSGTRPGRGGLGGRGGWGGWGVGSPAPSPCTTPLWQGGYYEPGPGRKPGFS